MALLRCVALHGKNYVIANETKGLVALCHLARKWTGTYCTPTEARTVQT